jgi:hypothetical protein
MRLRKRRSALGIVVFGAAAAGIAVASAACNFIVGAGDYHVAAGTAADAAQDDAARESEASACPGVVLPEASACVPVTTGALPPGGAACIADAEGSACYPHDTSGLAPTWTPTMGPHLGVCTNEQISGFYAACEDPTTGTAANCTSWKNTAANAACSACLYTPSTGTSYGAIVYYVNNQLDEVNSFGCISLVEPCNQPCGAALLAQLQCENASCSAPNCTNFSDYQTCSSDADNCTACQDLVTTAQNCQTLLTNDPANHPSVATCNLNATSFQDFYTTIATYLCGC